MLTSFFCNSILNWLWIQCLVLPYRFFYYFFSLVALEKYDYLYWFGSKVIKTRKVINKWEKKLTDWIQTTILRTSIHKRCDVRIIHHHWISFFKEAVRIFYTEYILHFNSYWVDQRLDGIWCSGPTPAKFSWCFGTKKRRTSKKTWNTRW